MALDLDVELDVVEELDGVCVPFLNGHVDVSEDVKGLRIAKRVAEVEVFTALEARVESAAAMLHFLTSQVVTIISRIVGLTLSVRALAASAVDGTNSLVTFRTSCDERKTRRAK